MSTVFREPEPTGDSPGLEDFKRDDTTTGEDVGDLKPIEDNQDILEYLGYEDDYNVLPDEDKENFEEFKNYLYDRMAEKGLSKTKGGFTRALKLVKEDFNLDDNADPHIVLSRIGSIAKSYRTLSFIKDLDQRKEVLLRLISAKSVNEMDKVIMQEMERRKIWQ